MKYFFSIVAFFALFLFASSVYAGPPHGNHNKHYGGHGGYNHGKNYGHHDNFQLYLGRPPIVVPNYYYPQPYYYYGYPYAPYYGGSGFSFGLQIR